MKTPSLFTMKHYARIIRVMSATRPTNYTSTLYGYYVYQWQETVNALADMFERDNPKHFKRDLFIRACNEQVTETNEEKKNV